MTAEDISKFYYTFRKFGHSTTGKFYKYLQKALTKTIHTFEEPHLKLMFYNFNEMETMRLNTGVRGRLVDRLKALRKE